MSSARRRLRVPPAARAMLGRTVRAGQELADPTPILARRFCADPPPAAIVSIYRRRNASVLQGILAAAPAGWPVRLWALDEVDGDLAGATVGSGPGLRSALVNRLVEELPTSFDGHVVVSDDDYDFVTGDVASLVGAAATAGFDLCQPAHCGRSHWSHRLTVRRLGSVARLTGFVEIGPVVVVASAARSVVFPLDEADGMGWGTDATWAALAFEGRRLGIVDWVRVRHHGRPGRGYDTQGLRRTFQERIDAIGGTAAVFRTHATWRPWRRRPPWGPPVNGPAAPS